MLTIRINLTFQHIPQSRKFYTVASRGRDFIHICHNIIAYPKAKVNRKMKNIGVGLKFIFHVKCLKSVNAKAGHNTVAPGTGVKVDFVEISELFGLF